MENILDRLIEIALEYGPKLLLALFTLIIGLWAIGILRKSMRRILTSQNIDNALIPYITSIAITTLKVLLGVSVLGMLGIEMTSFIAILGAAGLAVGLALSGTLQNFAGGVMILLLKPFKVGDFVEAAGYSGTVKEIQIFNTLMVTPDNKRIILPNSKIANDSMINYSAEPTRRVDMTFGISYEDDIDKAKAILMRLIEEDSRILKDPAPVVAVGALADSSVNFVVRPWVDAPNYWSVYFEMHEKVKKTFDLEGISIPFPQRDVHLYNR